MDEKRFELGLNALPVLILFWWDAVSQAYSNGKRDQAQPILDFVRLIQLRCPRAFLVVFGARHIRIARRQKRSIVEDDIAIAVVQKLGVAKHRGHASRVPYTFRRPKYFDSRWRYAQHQLELTKPC